MLDITGKFLGELPPGFRLEESEDELVLFHGDTVVARYYHSADPREVEKAAQAYLQGLQ